MAPVEREEVDGKRGKVTLCSYSDWRKRGGREEVAGEAGADAVVAMLHRPKSRQFPT